MWSALRGVEQRGLGLGALKLPALPGTALSLTVSPFRIVRLQVRRAQPALDRHPVDVTVLGLACALAARVHLGGSDLDLALGRLAADRTGLDGGLAVPQRTGSVGGRRVGGQALSTPGGE